MIQFRESNPDDSHSNGLDRDGRPTSRGKRRKQKVVIHSSPFLRCVQTSIAISAGMEQYRGSTDNTIHQASPKHHTMHSGSPHLRPAEHWNLPHLSAIPEPEDSSPLPRQSLHHDMKKPRTLLRVDAFLGEWLSPDYFDKITPPPASKMMVAGAKADLLHLEDPVDSLQSSNNGRSSRGNFPGGWSSGESTPISSRTIDDTTLPDLSSLSENLPKIAQANGHRNAASNSSGGSGTRSHLRLAGRLEYCSDEDDEGYTPPIPSYAISPSQPIPQGYVAHARDACAKVDYQWDSLRAPLEWGSGGEYGEEWSAMHRRFRYGLQKMMSWYKNHGPSERPDVTDEHPENQFLDGQLPHHKPSVSKRSENFDNDDVDTILVLVTHGAGCNALIGALTNQPVLIDVGMASLTMAVRKNVDYRILPHSDETPTSPTRRRRSSMDPGISDNYEVKLVASTEHLRVGSQFPNPLQRQRFPSLPVMEKSPYRYERRGTPNSHNVTSSPTVEEFSEVETPTNKNFGGLHRSATTAVHSASGLWSKPIPKQVEEAAPPQTNTSSPQDGQNSPLIKTPPKSSPKNVNRILGSGDTNDAPANADSGRALAQQGLWGAPPQALPTERDAGAKRRWTLSQA